MDVFILNAIEIMLYEKTLMYTVYMYISEDIYIFCGYSFPHSWLISWFVTRLTRRVSLVEQELLTLPENLCSPPVFSWVRVTRPLVLCVYFVDRCLSFCIFYFGILCCLFFFDIRILITPLVSSNTSKYTNNMNVHF